MNESAENKLYFLVERVKKVRRWMVWLALLKLAALCLVFVSVYIGLYAWLDHRLHFNGFARIMALMFLIVGIIILLLRLCKVLISHTSLRQAANHIESENSFEQQLVAAVEYHEDDTNYPYSRELADELVKRVDVVTANTDFESTVSKWLFYVLGAVIVFGTGIVGFYLFDNYTYFSRYFARLTHPLAKVEPIPPTSLKPVTGDIIIEPDSLATLSAQIEGRLPEYGNLVLADANETSDDQNYTVLETLQLRPVINDDEKPKFEAGIPFEKAGKFRYRFEVEDAVSPWQDITVCTIPTIKKITADIRLSNTRYVKPYQQEVEDFSLEVIEGSHITLTVLASENLDKVIVSNLDSEKITKELNNTNKFSFTFDAKQNGFIEFVLSSAKDVINEAVQPLQVKLKVDTPATFKLTSPVGDYMATNVSSVPISFEITDDFGLKSASMSWEIAGREPETFNIPIVKGVRSKKFTRTLELENYDLQVGDSIIFYANATEFNAARSLVKSASNSDIYFIEIKPYRQRWHQIKGGALPGQPKQGLEPDKALLHDKLIDVLEYTRAFLKKTWKIAGKRKLDDRDRKRLESIGKDIEYAGEQIELIREDPRYGFGQAEKTTLNEVLASYYQAGADLASHKPKAALVPEKQAYRILRKFIIELEKILLPPGNVPPPPPKLDKIKMEELVHLTRFEKERIEWELNRLAQKLEQIAREQEKLREKFERFLEEQKKAKKLHQETTDEKAWTAKNEKPPEDKPCKSCGNFEPGSCPDCESTVTVEGSLKPPLDGSEGNTDQQAKGKKGDSGKASMKEKMEMLQAKQKAIKAQVEYLKEELKKLASKENQASNQKGQKALEEAAKQMEKFDVKLTAASYRPKQEEKKLAEALSSLKQASGKIGEAIAELTKELNFSEKQMLANNAAKLAEKMAKLSKEIEVGVNPYSKEQLLRMLKETEGILETAEKLETQNTDASPSHGLGAAFFKEMRKLINSKKSAGSVALAGYFSKLARELWSAALITKKLDSGVVEDTPSDAKFYELENEFFENAARFGQ